MTEIARKITVLIVDDHPLMRVGIATIINAHPDFEVIGQASRSKDAVELFLQCRPDVTLMDLRLPDGSGADAIRMIREVEPRARIVVVTTYEGDEDIHQAIASGAQGYVIKGMPYEMLVSAIKKVHRGGRFLPPPVARVLAQRNPRQGLTAREKEVLALMIEGKTNPEIADALRIARATVKAHVEHILSRLDVTDRTRAVVVALQRGIAHL
ncbi:MAG TPA: response regulator transcription factor [Alloacidobacterium sp.]|jgi:DNA-binding NarL/FixJ family response regulator|nr:response regulator transcription factor [Alloacidobacterium sp.]